MIRTFAFPLLAMLAGGAAARECPTAEDLAGGIRFHEATGETETFHRLPNGMVRSLYDLGDGDGSQATLAKGVYLVELIDRHGGEAVPGSRVTYVFPEKDGPLPDPAPGMRWDTEVVSFEGGRFTTEPQSYRVGDETTQTYGGCAYAVIPIEIHYAAPDQGGVYDVLHYLPALGISYLAEYHDEDNDTVYIYVNIEALK